MELYVCVASSGRVCHLHGQGSDAILSTATEWAVQRAGGSYMQSSQGHETAHAKTKTNTLAIAALVSSFFIGVTGVILGHIALHQIKTTGERGPGMAMAALIIGYTAIVISPTSTARSFRPRAPKADNPAENDADRSAQHI